MFSRPSLLECEFLGQGKSKRGGLLARKYISRRHCPTLLFKIKVKKKKKNPEMTLKYSSRAKSRGNKNKGHTGSAGALSES